MQSLVLLRAGHKFIIRHLNSVILLNGVLFNLALGLLATGRWLTPPIIPLVLLAQRRDILWALV